MSAILARDVTYQVRGRTLLHGVDFDAGRGELVGIVGPNGAGKSTLLGVLAGDLPPAAGTVEIGGRPATAWSTRDLARIRAVLLQENTIGFPFSVREVVAMGCVVRRRRRSRPSPDEHEAVVAALRTAEVEDLAERRVTTLSVGERARVCFARTLVQQADVLLLDEPTAALDIRHQHLVMAAARREAQAGRTVVAIVHDLTMAAAYADRVCLMVDGRVAALDTPDRVLTGPLLTEAFRYPIAVQDADEGLQVRVAAHGVAHAPGD